LNKISIIISLLIYLFFIAACGTTKNAKLLTTQIAKDNQAVIYIYRPFATSNAIYSPELYINDEFKLSMKNEINARFTLPPGYYKFELEPDKNFFGRPRLLLNLSANSTYFVRVDTSLKIKSALTYEPYQRSFNLTRVDEQQAVKEIAECCMATDIKSNTDQETNIEKTQTEVGFSVDKTQNPFSH
jgi:hypothetical protein